MAEGIKHDEGKLPWHLLPWGPVSEVVRVLQFGAKKYSANNWMKVPDSRDRYFSAAIRHLVAWSDGHTKDSESGLSHLAHAACCILFLMFLEPTYDRRDSTAPKDGPSSP